MLRELTEQLFPAPCPRAPFEGTARAGLWIIAGAGLSAAPPAQIPTWQRIKAETLQEASAVLKAQNAVWGNTFTIPQAIDERASDLLEFPEEALEDLCLSYGVEATIRRLTAVIGRSAGSPAPTGAHHAIATLSAQGKVAGIITTNFDTLLEDALRAQGVKCQVALAGELPTSESTLPILKVHGTLEDPRSLSFRRTAYYRGLPQQFRDFVRERVRDVEVLIVGYSGNDSDLFPLLAERLALRAEGIRAILVDPSVQGEGSAFGELVGRRAVKHVQMTADAFFGRETPTAASVPESSSVLPSESVGSVLAFLGLAISRTHRHHAHDLFFLLQDIADTAHDLRLKAIAHFGKCLSEHTAQESADEFSMGWKCSEQARAVRPERIPRELSAWSVSALVHLTRFELAGYVAARGVPQQILLFYHFWQALIEELRDKLDEESLTAAKLSQAVLVAIADGQHNRRQSAAGFLNVIAAAKASGHYEFELDALELLDALNPTERHLAVDFPEHRASVKRQANAGQRRSFAEIGSQKFVIRGFVGAHEGGWNVSESDEETDESTARATAHRDSADSQPTPYDQDTWDHLRMKGHWNRDAHARAVVEQDPVAKQVLVDYTLGQDIATLRKRLTVEASAATKDVRLFALGELEHWSGDLKTAAETLRKSSEISNAPVRGLACYKLGIVLEKLGDVSGAMEAHRVSMAASDEVLAGPPAFNLGILLWNSGRAAEAVPAWEQAASSGHPDAAPAALYHLALARFRHNDVSGTLELLREAAGFDHEELAPKASYELGALLAKLGRTSEAIDALLKAASSPNSEIGPMAAVDLGMEYANVGDSGAARTWWERAARSGNPRQSGMAQRNLERLRAAECEPHLSRMIPSESSLAESLTTTIEQVSGVRTKTPLSAKGYPVCPQCGHELGTHAARMRITERDAQADGTVVQCPDCGTSYVPDLSPAHRSVLNAEQEVLAAQCEANELARTGRLTEALAHSQRALRVAREFLDKAHPGFATSVNNVAAIHKLLGEYNKAAPLYLEALDIWQRVPGKHDENVATGFSNLGALYREMGSYVDAEWYFKRALELRRKLHGDLDARVARCWESLARLYDTLGRNREAVDCRERAIRITNRLKP